MKKLTALTLLTGALLAAGCESATGPGIDAWRNPEAGSFLVYRTTDSRTLNGQTTSDISSLSLEIIESGIQKWGKNNASVALGPGGDSIVFAVEDNGDFSIGEDGRWELYPTGGDRTITVRDLDTLINGTDREVWTETRTFAGEEDVTVGDRSFYAIRIIQNEMKHETGPLYDYKTIATDTIWFSPDIGFFVKQVGTAQNFESNNATSTHRSSMELQAYIKQ